MESIQRVLNAHKGIENPRGQRQLNATLSLDDFAKLSALSDVLGASKRRLASDLLAAAVQEAYLLESSDGLIPAYDHHLEGLEATDDL